MKKTSSALVLGAIVLFSSSALAETLTTSKYKEIRRKMREEDVTEFQAKKVCDVLDGVPVRFESYVMSVKSSGLIMADMDKELFSVYDINIFLSDRDEATNIKNGQEIRYGGVISSCSYNRTMGTLSLDVSKAYLIKHY